MEAAALGGRPVAFMATGPWRKPWRMPEPSQGHESLTVLLVFALAFCILGGAALVARANLREGRGDQAGATRLAACMFAVLMAVWACQVHLVASIGLPAMFLLAICTAVFYGVLLWTIYLALEPFVRKRWPQVLVSWTNVLAGHVRDPVVGRDVLVGLLLGVGWVLLIRGVDLATSVKAFVDFPGEMALLAGLRRYLGVVLQVVPYAMRNVLLYFFLLFLLRVLLRSQWLAAIGLTLLFIALSVLGNTDRPALERIGHDGLLRNRNVRRVAVGLVVVCGRILRQRSAAENTRDSGFVRVVLRQHALACSRSRSGLPPGRCTSASRAAPSDGLSRACESPVIAAACAAE